MTSVKFNQVLDSVLLKVNQSFLMWNEKISFSVVVFLLTALTVDAVCVTEAKCRKGFYQRKHILSCLWTCHHLLLHHACSKNFTCKRISSCNNTSRDSSSFDSRSSISIGLGRTSSQCWASYQKNVMHYSLFITYWKNYYTLLSNWEISYSWLS